MRPLFPESWRNETQINAMVLSADSDNDPDVIAVTGAAAAAYCSDLPFPTPIAAVRVGLLNGQLVARPPYATTYWTAAQMLAHMTVNGASTRTGDLFGSGTVSGPDRDQRGCLLELSWGGAEPLTLPDGSVRSFLEDGDEVTISATAPAGGGGRIGFGEVTGRIQPAASGAS